MKYLVWGSCEERGKAGEGRKVTQGLYSVLRDVDFIFQQRVERWRVWSEA